MPGDEQRAAMARNIALQLTAGLFMRHV